MTMERYYEELMRQQMNLQKQNHFMQGVWANSPLSQLNQHQQYQPQQDNALLLLEDL